MQTIQINAAADERVLILGRRGENEVLSVEFDVSAWLEEFGNGVVSLFAQRAGDASAYPVVLTVGNGVATWLVTATDTNVRGLGRAELVLTVDEAVKKSAVWQTFVGEDIGQPIGDPPDPFESWLEQLAALGDAVQENAQRAETAQAAAETAQSGADASALVAEGWAKGTQSGTAVESGTYFHDNAKYYKDQAEAVAQSIRDNLVWEYGTPVQIVEPTEVSFSYDSSTEQYISAANPISGMVWDDGFVYDIHWDDVTYRFPIEHIGVTFPTDYSHLGEMYCLGKLEPVGFKSLFDTNAPFAIIRGLGAASQSAINKLYILSYDTASSHTVSVDKVPVTVDYVERTYNDPVKFDTASGAIGIGFVNKASAPKSIAIGVAVEASSNMSVAIGNGSKATAVGALVFGTFCEATAYYAVAMGYKNKASGNCSFCANLYTEASGQGAAAFGSRTKAAGQNQVALGLFNVEDTQDEFAVIVGNGTADDARSNAATLDWNGHASFAGDVTINGGTENEVTVGQALADKAKVSELLKAFPTDTASGAVASFPDGADGLPVKDLTVAIEPVQSGSGDPSPTNVRPISGWTGVTVSHSGADTSDPETLTVSWQTEAGAVYGGKLDVTTGVLTVDREFVTVSDPDALTSGGRNYCKYKLGAIGYVSQAPKAYSSVLKKYSGTASAMPEGAFTVVNSTAYNGSFLYFCFPGCSASSSSACLSNNKAYLETLVNNGITPQFVFGLSTPLTYQLTPQEVATLLGENNIWADTGNVSVEYRADTTMYINTRLSAIVSMLANVETSLTASRAYSVNDFLTVNGQLYKVTANIASGGTITPGTNVAETTVGAQLSALLNS